MLSSLTPFLASLAFSDWATIISLIIGALAIVIGFGISYLFYQKAKIVRAISYRTISDTPIVRNIPKQEGRGNIKVIYEESRQHERGGNYVTRLRSFTHNLTNFHKSNQIEDISDARLLNIKVWNIGNTDIKIWNSDDQDIEDMEEPIEFEFGKRTLVSITQVKTNPPEKVINQKHLTAYLNKPLQSSNNLGLPHCLLKPSESIELSVLLKGEPQKNQT